MSFILAVLESEFLKVSFFSMIHSNNNKWYIYGDWISGCGGTFTIISCDSCFTVFLNKELRDQNII